MDETSGVDADCQPSAKKKARLQEDEVADNSPKIGDGGLEWQDGPTRVAVDTAHSVPLTGTLPIIFCCILHGIILELFKIWVINVLMLLRYLITITLAVVNILL